MDSVDLTGIDGVVRGYDRRAVDEFFDRAAQQRLELDTVIAQARARQERADALVQGTRIAASILSEGDREIERIRTDAEARASEIVLAAEREAKT